MAAAVTACAAKGKKRWTAPVDVAVMAPIPGAKTKPHPTCSATVSGGPESRINKQWLPTRRWLQLIVVETDNVLRKASHRPPQALAAELLFRGEPRLFDREERRGVRQGRGRGPDELAEDVEREERQERGGNERDEGVEEGAGGEAESDDGAVGEEGVREARPERGAEEAEERGRAGHEPDLWQRCAGSGTARGSIAAGRVVRKDSGGMPPTPAA